MLFQAAFEDSPRPLAVPLYLDIFFLSVSQFYFFIITFLYLPLFPIFHLKRKAVCRRQTGP